jgi:hypothetical protein
MTDTQATDRAEEAAGRLDATDGGAVTIAAAHRWLY